MGEFFLPEMSVVVYAALSVLLCWAVYRLPLATFKWGAASMRRPAGNVGIRQVDLNDSPAQAASTSAVNVMNSMTPGGMASLVVLGVWLLAAFLGITIVPAFFRAMDKPTTLNVLLVGVGGLCIAFAMARLTLTLIGLALGLALMALMLGTLAVVVLYLANFVSGGRMQMFDSLKAWQREVSIYQSIGLGEGGMIRRRADFNWCVFHTSLSNVGDMRATRSNCDPTWIDPQSQAAYERTALREKLLRTAGAARAEVKDWAMRNAHGFPTQYMPLNNQSLTGNWAGNFRCGDKYYVIWLSTEGDERSAKGVMHVFRASQSEVAYEPGMPKSASTYRVALEKTGNTVKLRPGERLLAGEGTPAIEGTFEYSLGYSPSLVRPSTSPACHGYFEGLLTAEALSQWTDRVTQRKKP